MGFRGEMMGRREELEEELKKIVEKVKKDKSIKLILLFGSLARGNVGSASDIDLIVVKERELSGFSEETAGILLRARGGAFTRGNDGCLRNV